MIKIPTWEETRNAVDSNMFTPLDTFVYNWEPAGKLDSEFRENLKDLLEWATTGLSKVELIK